MVMQIQSLHIDFDILGADQNLTHQVKVDVPYIMLMTGFKIAFIVPDALEQMLREILKAKAIEEPLPFWSDCLEEWLMAWRGENIELSSTEFQLKIRWS